MIGNCSKIRSSATLRHILHCWSKNAASRHITSNVPSGHIAICVGSSRRRFVIPVKYLNHRIFQNLLVEAEEEYSFANQGLLTIPCDESVFEEILLFVSQTGSFDSRSRLFNLEDYLRCCHVDYRTNIGESRPLIQGGLLSSTCK